MKKYRRLLLIGLSTTMLSLQGCSAPKEDNSEEIKILEEKVKELEEDKDNLEKEVEEQGDIIVTQQQMILDQQGEVKEEEQIEEPEEYYDDEMLEQNEQPAPYSFEVSEEVLEELQDSNLAVIDSYNEINDESDIVDYFECMSAEVDIDSEEQYYNDAETIQNKLATFVLFLNDELKIKGYTFSDLKASAQVKIINAFESLDKKVDSVVPGYSRPILDAFSFIEEKANKGIVILSNSLNQAFGEQFRVQTKEGIKDGYDDMKESYGFWKEKILEKAREEKRK